MNKLPKNWSRDVPLMDISTVNTGKKDANFASDVGQYHFFTCAYESLRSDSYSYEGNVIILPGNGVNVGEVFYFEGKFEAYQRTYIINDIHINSKYLFYHLKRYWREKGANIQFGSATNYIKIGNFKDYKVEFPPLPEQERIVAKLDKLFGHLDVLKERLDKIPGLLKNFRQAVLTQAVTGKLLAKNVEHKTFPLSSLCIEFKYGSSSKSLNEGTIPVLRMGNLQDGKLDYSDLKYSIDPDEIEKYKLEKGDVLFNRTNSPELVGKTAVFDGQRESIYAGYIIKVKCSDLLLPEYLNYALNSSYGRQWCSKVKSDGVSQSNINAKKLRSFEISIPSIGQQEIVVQKAETLLKRNEALTAKYYTLKQKIDQLPQAILSKAFKGELVEQLPTDGDAKELLEEIKNLKAEMAKKKTKNK